MRLCRYIKNSIRLSKKFIFILRNKLYFSFLYKYGIAATTEHDLILKKIIFKSLIDVGANKGQFILSAINRNNNVKIFAFEPIYEICQKLKNIFYIENKYDVNIFQCALGSQNINSEINISNKIDSSSILNIGKNQNKIFFGTHAIKKEKIKIIRLDSIISKDQIDRPSLLKIDVQGYEENVLLGVGELFKVIDYIYCECSMIELYDNQPLFVDIYTIMKSNKFKLININNPYLINGELVQADFLFKNENSIILH